MATFWFPSSLRKYYTPSPKRNKLKVLHLLHCSRNQPFFIQTSKKFEVLFMQNKVEFQNFLLPRGRGRLQHSCSILRSWIRIKIYLFKLCQNLKAVAEFPEFSFFLLNCVSQIFKRFLNIIYQVFSLSQILRLSLSLSQSLW